MGLGVGRRNRSAMRELASELRDEGVGQRAREKKKNLRKKEERREAGERKRK